MKNTIAGLAGAMSANMEWKTRTDGSEYYSLKEREKWQVDIIHGARLERMPNDDIYSRIQVILDALESLDDDATQDDALERLQEIETDVYTSDLTTWLASDNRNVYFLEEAQAMGSADGFNQLMTAQYLYIQEIARAVLDGILAQIEENQDAEGFRICDECQEIMAEGYCIDSGAEYYCSEKCLHKHYTPEEWAEMYADGEGDRYFTTRDE